MKYNVTDINHQPLSEYLGKNWQPIKGGTLQETPFDSTVSSIASKFSVSGINAYYADTIETFVEYPETRIHFTNEYNDLVILTDVDKVDMFNTSFINDSGELIINIDR